MTRDEFIQRLAVTFGPPDTADEDLFLQNYADVIGTTQPRVLDVAFSIIRDEQEFKAWPMPAVVRKAIASAALRVHGSPHKPDVPHHPRGNPSPESRRRIQELVANLVQVIGDPDDKGPKKIVGVTRPEFEAMQRASPNRHLHTEPNRGLTERSRRMMGD